jgi:hypothetical protein
MPPRLAARALLGLLFGVTAAPVANGQVTFTRITDNAAIPPGGTTLYNGFDAPVLGGGVVTFRAVSNNFNKFGVYTAPGGTVTRVADTTSAIPGGTGNFTQFSNLSAGADRVAFVGDSSTTTSGYGVYSAASGVLSPVVDLGTPVPDGGSFTRFNRGTAVAGGTTYFSATQSSGAVGLFSAAGGSVTRLVDDATPVPGGTGTFTFVFQPAATATGVAFWGQNAGGRVGVYTAAGGTVARVADTDTPVPGGAGMFTGFSPPGADGGVVAFAGFTGTASGSKPSGVYAATDGGPVVRIADLTTPLPDSGAFDGFGDVSVSDAWVAFTTTRAGDDAGSTRALYVRDAAGTGPIIKVVAPGDVIDGHTVGRVQLSRYGLDGDQIAFTAYFTDGPFPGDVAVYVATVPVPEPAAVLAVAAVGLAAVRAWRRNGRRSDRRGP